MITPNGKNRIQVNQGGQKNQSIWDSSWFRGVSGDMTKSAIAATSPTDKPADPMTDAMTEQPDPMAERLQGAMDNGNSMRMNQDMIPQEGEMKKKGPSSNPGSQSNPEEWAFDPMSGEPLAGLNGEEVYEQAYKMFAQQNLKVEVKGDLRGGNWTVTIGPGAKAVSKGGRG